MLTVITVQGEITILVMKCALVTNPFFIYRNVLNELLSCPCYVTMSLWCVLQHVPSCSHILKLFHPVILNRKLDSKPTSSGWSLSLLFEVVVDIHWSKNSQRTNQRPSLFTDTITKKVIATFLAHHSSDCNFDVCYHNNSTDTYQNLLKEWNRYYNNNIAFCFFTSNIIINYCTLTKDTIC